MGRPSHELGWILGSDLGDQALQAAKDLFEQERILEYQCYDRRWQSQGSASGLFTGSHGPSSDGYYAWFVEHQMVLENGLYHICDCEASTCKVQEKRGDNQELIHIDHWRLLTPAAMVVRGMGLQLGETSLANAARAKKAHSPRLGSGL